MSQLDKLEKLYDLKQEGVISQEEFDAQKAVLLNATDSGQKSQAIYCLLAFFLGNFGIHNFYAGRWKQALAQLLLTLLAPFSLFVGCTINYFWVVINIFSIHTDGKGHEFRSSPIAKYISGILLVIWNIIMLGILFFTFLIIGAGPGMLSNRHILRKISDITEDISTVIERMVSTTRRQANDILDKVAMISIVAMSKNGGEGGDALLTRDLYGVEVPMVADMYSTREGVVTITFSGASEKVVKQLRDFAGNRVVNGCHNTYEPCVIDMR